MTFLRFHLISWQLFHGSGFAGLECFDWTPPGVCARYLKFKCRTIDEDIYQLSSVDTSYDEGVFWGIGSDLNLLPSGEMIICHPVKVSMGRTIDPNDSVWEKCCWWQNGVLVCRFLHFTVHPCPPAAQTQRWSHMNNIAWTALSVFDYKDMPRHKLRPTSLKYVINVHILSCDHVDSSARVMNWKYFHSRQSRK